MQQYIFIDQYKGQPRKLLILTQQSRVEYRVFCESNFLGSIQVVTENDVVSWKSDYNMLKPIVSKIRSHIETVEQKQSV